MPRSAIQCNVEENNVVFGNEDSFFIFELKTGEPVSQTDWKWSAKGVKLSFQLIPSNDGFIAIMLFLDSGNNETSIFAEIKVIKLQVSQLVVEKNFVTKNYPSALDHFHSCVVLSRPTTNLVCVVGADRMKKSVQLVNFPLQTSSESTESQTLPLTQVPQSITNLASSHIMLSSSSSNAGDVYALDKAGQLTFKYTVQNVALTTTASFDDDDDADHSWLFVAASSQDRSRASSHSQQTSDFHLAVYNLATGDLIDQQREWTLASHHGQVESMDALVFKDSSTGQPNFNLILHTRDHALQLIRQNGRQQWVREEALASIQAVEFVDLPVSEVQARMDEEFGHSTGNIFDMFVKRIKGQLGQLKVVFRQFLHHAPHYWSTLVNNWLLQQQSDHDSITDQFPGDDSSFNDDDSPSNVSSRYFSAISWPRLSTKCRSASDDDEENQLIRDTFNLHKLIVVATSVGKIYALDSENGRLVWHYLIDAPKTYSPTNDDLEAGQRLVNLFIQRTTAHFPLAPITTLIWRSKGVAEPLVLSFNPITGVPMSLKNDGQATTNHDNLYHQPGPIIQATLKPGPISEQTDFIRPILFITTDLEVKLYPNNLSASKAFSIPSDRQSPVTKTTTNNNKASQSLSSTPTFVYTIQRQEALLTGYRLVPADQSTSASLAWHLDLGGGGGEGSHEIVAATGRPVSEHVYSVGRVLGDRNVMYKYLNANLLAVLTSTTSNRRSSEGSSSSTDSSITLYLVDLVTGRIVYSTTHRRCSSPTNLVISENWIVYTFYNQRSLRHEAVALELYEATNRRHSQGKPPTVDLCSATGSIPPPWRLFLHNLASSTSSSSGDSSTSNPSTTLFSSLLRTTDADGLCQSTGNQVSLIPTVLRQAYILPSSPRQSAMAVSVTEKGITSKSIILALERGSLIELPKALFDPRRSLDMTPSLMEEGVHPYTPVLPLPDQSILSYNLSLANIKSIRTNPTGLESTSLVFAHGLDLFFTRIAPSMTFDLLKEDFDYTAIAAVTLGMIITSLVTHRLAARKVVHRAWA